MERFPDTIVGQGNRESAWKPYTNGRVWELDVFADLGYSKPMVELDQPEWEEFHRAAQNKAQNSARRWGGNNGYKVRCRKFGWQHVVVSFTPDPDSALNRGK